MHGEITHTQLDAATVRYGLAQTLAAHILIRLQKRHSLAGLPSLAVFSLDRVSTEIAAHGIYEKISLDLLLKSALFYPEGSDKAFDVVIDVGAHVGNHALYFSRHAKRVIAFEPNPELYKLLSQNVGQISNIKTFQQALSSRQHSATLSGSVNNLGGASISVQHGKPQFTVEVEAVSLDGIEESFRGERVSLIKCDVEGAEPDVLLGAERTIRQHKPLLAFEFAQDIALRRRIQSAIRELDCNYNRVWWPENFRASDSWARGIIFGKRVSLNSSYDFADIPSQRLPFVVFQASEPTP